jgi:hypothetical protein
VGRAAAAPGGLSSPRRHGFWLLLTLALILAVSSWRILFLALDCPFDLSTDEAHYWDWSRRLDWSYYSKGPLIAYLIRGSCELFGPLATSICGNAMPAVRLPAVLLGGLTLLGLFTLTRRVYGDSALAFLVVLAAVCSPMFAAGALLMTIDAPFACCWTWSLVLAHRALFPARDSGSIGDWLLLGLTIGLGILAKYTMVLFVPMLALFLLASPAHRPLLRSRGLWFALGLAAACCAPIILWNAQHDWETLRHVGRQSGIAGDGGVHWLGPLEYVAVQAGLLLGVGFALWAAAVIGSYRERSRLPREVARQEAFLRWLGVPVFGLFLAFSLITRVEPNWPMPAYLAGLVLTAGWLRRRLDEAADRTRLFLRTALICLLAAGFAGSLAMHRSELFYPLIPKSDDPIATRRFDPTCRLRGWQTLAGHVEAERQRLSAAGETPLLAGSSWHFPGILSFYLPDQPDVYCFGLAADGRHSQYDLWRPTPVHDPARFHGRTFIYVGPLAPRVRAAFDTIETTNEVTYHVAGRAVARWQITVCRGFRGFPSLNRGGY